MLEGQRLQLDHDDADPTRYLGWSHGRCNERAGASKGNRQRAAAYRAARGLPEPTAPRANGGVILKPAAPTGYQAKLLREARLESGVTPGTTRPLSGEWIECYHPVFGWVRQRWW